MTTMTRRSMLAGSAAAVGALGSGMSALRAAAPQAGKQGPSFYRHKLGEFELTQVCDGRLSGPLLDQFVRNVAREQVNGALDEAFLPRDQITSNYNPVVINTGAKLILFDTGCGPNPAVNRSTAGKLIETMTAAGIDPKAIDMVVISHFHFDHINGLRAADNSLAFPNAEIKVPTREWAFWTNDAEMARAPEGVVKATFGNSRRVFEGLAGRVTHYDWGQEVAPGITAMGTPGHTLGHTSFTVQSGSAKLLIQSDVTNVPHLFLRNPGWHVMFDMDAAMAEQTRRKFFDMAAAERAPIVGYHYPFPAVGYVEKDGNRYRLVPVAWNPVI